MQHPQTYNPATHVGCTLNVEESDQYPFCYSPVLLEYKGEFSIALGLKNFPIMPKVLTLEFFFDKEKALWCLSI